MLLWCDIPLPRCSELSAFVWLLACCDSKLAERLYHMQGFSGTYLQRLAKELKDMLNNPEEGIKVRSRSLAHPDTQ